MSEIHLASCPAHLLTSRLPSPWFLYVVELVCKVGHISAWCPGHLYEICVSSRPWRSYLPEVGTTDLISGRINTLKNMRGHRTGRNKSAPSRTCRQKKLCSVTPSARCHKGWGMEDSSTLFTNQDPQSDKWVWGYSPRTFFLLIQHPFHTSPFLARLPTKPKLA